MRSGDPAIVSRPASSFYLELYFLTAEYFHYDETGRKSLDEKKIIKTRVVRGGEGWILHSFYRLFSATPPPGQARNQRFYL